MTTTYRLADETLAETLLNRWGAWWMTFAPLPAALHLQHFQLPLLRGYVQNPEFHARAAADPSMKGSAFVGIPAERAGAVDALLQQTMEKEQDALALASAWDELNRVLLEEAKGQSLEPFYERIPPALKGLVELVYDYTNRPSVRVFEGAAYRSAAFRRERQCLRLSKLQTDSGRPSLWSTPTLADESGLEWRIDFADPRVDQLFALDVEPKPLAEIAALLEVEEAQQPALLSLLTEAPAAVPPPWSGEGVRVRYLGHASVLVEWQGRTLLMDPVVSPRPAAGGRPRVGFGELPRKLDVVAITHAHADHFLPETLLRLRHRVGTLLVPRTVGWLAGDVSLKWIAEQMGFRDVREFDAYQSLPFGEGEIVALPFLGEHGDVAHGKSGWVLRAGAEQIFFAADSACLDATVYENARRTLGDIQTVFMNTETEGSPLGFGQEALFPRKRDRRIERDRRCRGSTAAEGLRLLEALGAKRVYNYAMGFEPWLEFIIGPPAAEDSPRMKQSNELLQQARERGLVAERLNGPADWVLPG